MANYVLIIFALMILHCTRIRCANSDSNALQDIREANIASVFIKMAEETKDPLIQILGKSFQRIVKKVDAFDMFIEKICSITLCTDWSEWTVCVFKKRNRTRSCRKASSFCLEKNSESCETCEHRTIQDPQSDGECTNLRPKIVLSPLKIRATEDKPVSFQCEVSGEGPFNVVWSRLDSRQLPDRATVSPRYSLTIRNLKRDDTGRYICTATNRYGVTRREVELIVIAVEVCGENEFRCLDGRGCISFTSLCDGRIDCSDLSDEANCAGCRPGEFQCTDGGCVDITQRCDNIPDCADGSDEGRFCGTTCLEGLEACPQPDGTVICVEKAVGCVEVCGENEFQCLDGRGCISFTSLCDGRIDCSDLSDEANCECAEGEFQCIVGRNCISGSRRCDSRNDCEDGSDEANCPCPDGFSQCLNTPSQECFSTGLLCDKVNDCSDGSDEINCARCSSGEFECESDRSCISLAGRCNGREECSDGSDEMNCPLVCDADQLECAVDNKCLEIEQICDRVYDCSDGRDERNCPRCSSGEFECESDRSCISLAGRCNGREECSDGSDEMNCPTQAPIILNVSPNNLRIRQGAEAIITCMAQGLPSGASVEWFRGTVGLPMQSAVVEGKLMISDAKVMYSGDYTCRVVNVPGNYQATARLEIVAIGPTPRPEGGDRKCGRDEAVCQNGECIRREYRCDGEEDCSDGSDELCETTLCEPNEFQCPSGQCVMKIWRCDGENDCEDGFDESNCMSKLPDEPCGRDEFQCISGNQCVPLAYQCDQEIDCLDRSDEIGCSLPIITVPPVAEIEVELGGTFTIICEAVGVPTPLIVWRLNLGNIPVGDRVTTVSEGGRGILTVREAQYSDAGAYTCEAINNRGSIFATPDALVIVRRK